MRIVSYNIRHGGVGREPQLAGVIRHVDADVVVLQEASDPVIVARLAAATGMKTFGARPRISVAFMARVEVARHAWHRPRWSRRAFLELVLADTGLPVFGVHLTAVHSNVTEYLRTRELRALLAGIARHEHGAHVVAGDFNTLAPGERLDPALLPTRLRWLVWANGGRIRWKTIQLMLEAQYVDVFRRLHPDEAGPTFPTWSPHIRLDYAFASHDLAGRIESCRVATDAPQAADASDHFPLVVDLRASLLDPSP